MTDAFLRHHRTADDGAVVVEFSIVFVLFATLVAGIIQYGALFAANQSMAHAASEAVRSVVNIPDGADAGDDSEAEALAAARSSIESQLGWLDGNLTTAGADTDGRAVDYTITFGASCSDCIDVEITFNWEDDAFVPTILPVGTPATLTATSSLKYQ